MHIFGGALKALVLGALVLTPSMTISGAHAAAQQGSGVGFKKDVTITIPAGGVSRVNTQQLGLPRYGLSSLEIGLESVSGHDLTGSLSVAPRGAVESVSVAPVEMPSGDVVADTATGIAGDVVLSNDSVEAISVVVEALDWDRAERVIPAPMEQEFIASAVRLGTPSWMAKMAIYDEDLAASTAVSSPLSTSVRKRGSRHGRDAAGGTCGNGYRLTGWNYTADYNNWQGSKLWSVSFVKRFCFNPTQRVVGSTYWNLGNPVFSTMGNNSWVHVSESDEISRYDGWGGKPKGSHISKQSHVLKHCAVKWVVCGGDQVYNYKIVGYGDGSKVPNWTS